jgi:hypothetical protein
LRESAQFPTGVKEALAMCVLETTDNPELEIRAIYCLSTTAGAFVKCAEVGELQQRLAAIETLINRRNGHSRRSDG